MIDYEELILRHQEERDLWEDGTDATPPRRLHCLTEEEEAQLARDLEILEKYPDLLGLIDDVSEAEDYDPCA